LSVHIEVAEEAHAEQPDGRGIVVDDHRIDVAHRHVVRHEWQRLCDPVGAEHHAIPVRPQQLDPVDHLADLDRDRRAVLDHHIGALAGRDRHDPHVGREERGDASGWSVLEGAAGRQDQRRGRAARASAPGGRPTAPP
jgi:hypothetical protein